jgi:hypothetical protein
MLIEQFPLTIIEPRGMIEFIGEIIPTQTTGIRDSP